MRVFFLSLITQQKVRTQTFVFPCADHEYDHETDCGGHDPSGAPGNGFHPTWGNMGTDSGGEGGVPTANRFRGPTNGNGLFWYSYEVGNVHMTVFSAEHNMTEGSPQYAFLQQDLASVDRDVTPWVIVSVHRPLYNSEQYASDYEVAINLKANLEPLFLQSHVNLVLAGHYHSYLRTCAVSNFTCVGGDNDVSEGIVHITVGCAGASLDSVALYTNDWTVTYDYAFGYSVISAVNSTALHVQYYLNQDGTEKDAVWLYQQA